MRAEHKDILRVVGSEVLIAGKPLNFWEKKFQLPLHLVYAPIIRDNLRAFKQVFESYYPQGRVCYAVKANTHPQILKIVKSEGCGADVASYNEARCALEAGLAAPDLDLNGNCKEDFLIEQAINKGMNIIADSCEEFVRVAQLAGKLKKKPKVLLRVSGYELEGITDDSVFTAGLWTKFGLPLREVPQFIAALANYPQVDFVGFHTHIGSQIAQLQPYQAVLGKMIELAQLLNTQGGKCKVINIGGGFPVAYVTKEKWIEIVNRIRDGYVSSQKGDNSKVFVWHDALAGFVSEGDTRIHLDRWTGERFYTDFPKEKMLAQLLQSEIMVKGKTISAVKALKSIGEPLLTIEPGRSIVEDAGITLARVGVVRKVAYEHDLVTLEMGFTSHGESLIEKPIKDWEIVNDYLLKDDKPFAAFIGCNLCFSGDMISKYKVFLQRKPRRGEVVLIHCTGAYSSSLLAAASNSFPRPPRLLIDEKGKVSVLSKRDSYRDIIQG